MTINVTSDDLWAFSLAFYGRPGVPALCLDLQDGHGADVNIVLTLLFAASRGVTLDAAAVMALDAAVCDWRDTVVVPLRAVRRRLKDAAGDGPQALRTTVKGAELTAERLEQRALAAVLGSDLPPSRRRQNRRGPRPRPISRNISRHAARRTRPNVLSRC